MSALNPFAECVTQILARLNYQKEVGRLLEGYRVIEFPRTEAAGVNDFPSVRLQDISYEENAEERGASFAMWMLTLEVATAKSLGIAAHLEACGLVLNAVETDTAGAVDLSLGGGVMNGIRARSDKSDASGNAFYSHLLVTGQTKPFLRGQR